EPAFSSSVPGEVQFSLDPLIPGSTDYISLVFAPPGEELAGELLTFDADLEVYDGGVLQQSANESSWMYVLCSYDPNAKYAYPAGFTDSHFITGDGPLDYTIVFQNTGSSVAQNVTLQDTLDTDLDFATLEILGASHDMNHVLDESTGELFFVFQNINLPDSTSNEPASHGYVHYRIWPDAGLAAGTQLNNTAWIYFDGNEPVITNTTWHEIFDCNGLANITGETEYCLGENLALSAAQQWVESFGWTVNGALSDTDAILDVLTTQSGMLSIGLTSENEICSETDEVEVQVYEWQLSDFTVAFDGTTWTFTGNDGEAWQWYYNGEEIDGAVEQTYESTEEGWYSLFTTTTTGCDIISEPMLVLSTDDITGDAVTFFPNPTDDIITFSRPVDHVALYDLSGQAVLETSRTTMLDLSLLAPGYYLLELEGSVMPVLLK
ncbi:MAG: T9SS type A sorting domain-containing protein, partial [Flavobacteriales bacterium]|nr:T9SS type A sorting domain-containing protein [Flavobacteriales bacterium]